MTTGNRVICGVAMALGLVLAAGTRTAMGAGGYTAVTILPITGGQSCVGNGVNDAGVVVGQSDNAAFEQVAFVYIGGETVELPRLSASGTANAWSINNSNVIVGECQNADGVTRAVRWQLVDGVWTINDLGTIANGAGFGVAMRINDAGQVIGYSTAASPGPYHATLWESGQVTDLGTLGYSGPLAYSQGLGLSNTGHYSGFAYRVLGGPEHGLTYLAGTRGPEDVTPTGNFSLAQWHNVNDSGVFGGYVGGSFTSGAMRAATYTPGVGFELLPLVSGLPESYGYDINNNGDMVGTVFQLNPVPEPNVFHAFFFSGGVTVDLNDVTTGLPGLMTEARDISNTGYIVGSAGEFSPLAVVLAPAPVTPERCSAADIAYGDGEPLPPFGPAGGFNPVGPDGGDFDCFFNFYFAAAPDNAVCDIAYGDGEPLPPFGISGGFNPGVDGGDFDCFFNYYFEGCR